MKNEKILTIIKGQEFKLSLKDKIEINDIFYDQYLEAAAMLENIVANEERDKQPDWKKAETENNIIAFCGERGEGKSSAMFTFINAVVNEKEQKESTIFAQCENVKNTVFSEPIVIDPSAFDNVHNVLDIIIASLYRKFSDKYDVSPERFANYRREELLNEFQKVYKDISLLNDPVKMLEEEYDYEGSIEKISKMGESLRLRRDLSNLVKLYLDYMMTEDSRNQYTSKKLLIAIDDLDMCNANAYKMAEQIRKYLIIPDIVIVMALKVEQLQLCVQEENFKNYSNVLKNQGKIAGAVIDVEDMAERYIAKLIPKSRRIYLPNVRYIENAKIVYQKNEEEIIYIYNSNIIFSNYRLNNPLQICLENYIIGICSLESLYKKLNIEILGISKEDFQKVIRRIENDNSNKIHAFRTIFSNIDLIMRFHEYCWKNRQSKESGNKDERGKTRAVVDRFFRNIERFYREYIDKNFEEKLNNLILRDSDGEEAVINISELYADLLQRSIEESVSFEEKQKQDKVKEMMDSLDFDVQPDEPLQSVSTYLKNKSAENVLKNVKNIIHNMKRYQVRHKDEKVEGDNAGFIIMREYAIDYYQRVAEFWVENPKLDIPEEMSKEYKDIAKDCSKYNEEK